MTYDVKLTVIVSELGNKDMFWRASAKCDDPAPGHPGVISVTGDSPERALRGLAYEMGNR